MQMLFILYISSSHFCRLHLCLSIRIQAESISSSCKGTKTLDNIRAVNWPNQWTFTDLSDSSVTFPQVLGKFSVLMTTCGCQACPLTTNWAILALIVPDAVNTITFWQVVILTKFISKHWWKRPLVNCAQYFLSKAFQVFSISPLFEK